MEKITFTDAVSGEKEQFYVLETTTLNQIEYLLVTVDEEGDSEALILKRISPADALEESFEVVEDEQELDIISNVFMELLEDVVIE